MITLDLFGEPQALQRPRFSRGKVFDPQSRVKEGFKWQIKSQYRNLPLASPVSLDITFFMPIPKATSGIKKKQMLNGVCFHMKRPDIDNLQKFILDCLNNLVIQDDAQVVEIRTRKIYSDKPGTLIRIFPKSLHQEIENEDFMRSN